MQVFTIIRPSELSLGVALAAAVRRQHPDWRTLVVTLADDLGEITIELERTKLTTAREVLLEPIDELAAQLTGDQLRRALVGPVITKLLEQHETVLYLDPSLIVVDRLDDLADRLDRYEIALVQYATGGFDEAMLDGSLHAGILAVRRGATTDAVLTEWPQGELITRAVGDERRRDPFHAWLDALPSRFDNVGIERRAGYMVGADHLLIDRLSADGDNGGVTWREQKTSIIDLGAIEPKAPYRALNRHRGLAEDEALLKVLDRYRSDAADELPNVLLPESFERLPDGTRLDMRLRRLAGGAIAEGSIDGSIFTARGASSFYSWLNAPAEHGSSAGITRYHQAIWEDRGDLREAYPQLDGSDAEGFAGWLNVCGVTEEAMPVELLPPRPAFLSGEAKESSRRAGGDPLWGVNVAGFFNAEVGLGEAARLLISGLDAAGVPALPVQGESLPACRQEAKFGFSSPDEAPFPINIICMNGDWIPRFAQEAGKSFFSDRYTIALLWWEAGTFPEAWRHAFDYIDEVWVASDLVLDLVLEGIAPTSPVPVVKISLPVSLPARELTDRSALGMPEGFVFLFVFDYYSSRARKNPEAVIRAFRQEFPPGSGASLVIKTINAEDHKAGQQQVIAAAGDHPDIHFIDRYVSAAEKDSMLASCDCYVSLHRSEGFGLTLAEAMWFERPVVATAYGGVLEFMNDKNSYPVGHEIAYVGDNAPPYPPDGQWADPDVDEAAALMRHVFNNPEEARQRGKQAAADIRRSHSPQVCGAAIAARLRTIYEQLPRTDEEETPATEIPPLDSGLLAEQIEGQTPPRGGLIARAVRSLANKVAAPELERQQGTNRALLDLIERSDERTRELTHDRMAAQAELLGRFRQTDARLADVTTQLSAASKSLNEISRSVENQLEQHRALPFIAEDLAFETWEETTAGTVQGFKHNPSEGHAQGVEFTDAFHGREAHVGALQRVFVELLTGATPILDIGCGRGELLDLLRDAAIGPATGVDLDPDMVAHSRAKGHTVELGDAVESLGLRPDRSLGAVISAQLIEHLPYADLLRLLDLSAEKLLSGGLFVAETVNPHCTNAIKAFWVDPTHQHPLFPETVLHLARTAGFSAAYIFFPNGSGDIEADRFTSPAYTLVASAR